MLPKFDLQILTEFGYTEMSAYCMRALAAKNDQILVISFGYG